MDIPKPFEFLPDAPWRIMSIRSTIRIVSINKDGQITSDFQDPAMGAWFWLSLRVRRFPVGEVAELLTDMCIATDGKTYYPIVIDPPAVPEWDDPKYGKRGTWKIEYKLANHEYEDIRLNIKDMLLIDYVTKAWVDGKYND
jgi:hypothetical protein